MTEQLEGVALSEAVARALGWMTQKYGRYPWVDTQGNEHPYPDFHTPEGEHRLRAEIERVGGAYDITCRHEDGKHYLVALWLERGKRGTGESKDNAATALARAFLKAMKQ